MTSFGLQILLKHGADANIRNDRGETALHEALERGRTLAWLEPLMAATDLHLRSNYHESALHVAARKNRADAVGALLRHGEDVCHNGQDLRGNTALHLAAGKGYREVVALLIAAPGVELNAPNKEASPLSTSQSRVASSTSSSVKGTLANQRAESDDKIMTRELSNWFSKPSLFGKNSLSTRTEIDRSANPYYIAEGGDLRSPGSDENEADPAGLGSTRLPPSLSARDVRCPYQRIGQETFQRSFLLISTALVMD
ncbi:unnamed protein product [Bemisia tabaci]|uniref:Uncharacterized protein n=1 Tax=Bemisia tabaci TaxID=7038 RepID=A0A9P0AD74_BEMTA|nr:unnamed protein product [Bemisia tabaci]